MTKEPLILTPEEEARVWRVKRRLARSCGQVPYSETFDAFLWPPFRRRAITAPRRSGKTAFLLDIVSLWTGGDAVVVAPSWPNCQMLADRYAEGRQRGLYRGHPRFAYSGNLKFDDRPIFCDEWWDYQNEIKEKILCHDLQMGVGTGEQFFNGTEIVGYAL